MTNPAQAVRMAKDLDYDKVARTQGERVKETINAIRMRLDEHKFSWSVSGTRDPFYIVRVQLPQSLEYDVSDAEKEDLLHALYADGWHSVGFQFTFGNSYVELRYSRKPITVMPLEGESFEATVDPQLPIADQVKEIVESGAWRYGLAFREFIPPSRIASVRIGTPLDEKSPPVGS